MIFDRTIAIAALIIAATVPALAQADAASPRVIAAGKAIDAAPEPTVWALLIGGVGYIGGAIRLRRWARGVTGLTPRRFDARASAPNTVEDNFAP